MRKCTVNTLLPPVLSHSVLLKPSVSLVCVFFQKYYVYTKPCMYIYSSSSFSFLKHKWKQTEHMVLVYVLSFLSLHLGNCSVCVHKGTSSFLLYRFAVILLYGLLQFTQKVLVILWILWITLCMHQFTFFASISKHEFLEGNCWK